MRRDVVWAYALTNQPLIATLTHCVGCPAARFEVAATAAPAGENGNFSGYTTCPSDGA